MKGLRRIFIGILLLPVLLVVLLILYELFGMAVNHAASARQTAELVRLLERELLQAEVIDQYTETGNTSGTGNHVDMLSVITFRTQADAPEIRRLLEQRYGLDEWSCRLEELEESYRVTLNTGAPFPDNIEGH